MSDKKQFEHENKHSHDKHCKCEHHECETNKMQSKEQEYLELAQRLKAEFENYKKRNAEIMTQSFDNGISHAVEKLLPGQGVPLVKFIRFHVRHKVACRRTAFDECTGYRTPCMSLIY